MGSSHETQQDRDQLANDLHAIISESDDPLPEVEVSLDSIRALAKIVQDVNSLTDRYSNDAWRRIRHIAEETGTGTGASTGNNNPPAIRLDRMERFKFNRAFLRVEIYLLTKFWTNAQGERHILDMGPDIEQFIPDPDDFSSGRDEFDSCLRYIFHAYRRHLKCTAKELGVPELPTRDDLPWVRNCNEDYEYQYEDYPTFTTDDPVLNFAQRSISEEQGFLVWLCEFGIGPLEQTHQVEDSVRRDELIHQFSRRHIWETVELCHRFSRYDYCVDQPLSSLLYGFSRGSEERNRHPVMNLYGRNGHQRYNIVSARWACALPFLRWEFRRTSYTVVHWREDIRLNAHGRWLTQSDTDASSQVWRPFRLKDRIHGAIPHGHPYMFDGEKYEFCSRPRRMD